MLTNQKYPYQIDTKLSVNRLLKTVTQKDLSSLWRGRVDEFEGELGKRWHEKINLIPSNQTITKEKDQAAALIGFACDIGVSRNQGRAGAKFGPDIIRQRLSNMPILSSKIQLTDWGNIITQSTELEVYQQSFANEVTKALDLGFFPIGLGGGHEIAYASFSGITNHLFKKYNDKVPKIGIINFDAHFDLRLDKNPSSGTPFLQIANQCKSRNIPFHYCCLGISQFSNTKALFKRAEELNVTYLTDEQIYCNQFSQTEQVINNFINQVDLVYLTICLDVLSANTAPGVSAPAAAGISLLKMEQAINIITSSKKLIMFDIAEMNPKYDIDNRTAQATARLVSKTLNQKFEI